MKVMRQLSSLAVGTCALAVAAFAGFSVAQADGMPSKGRAVVYEKPSNWSGFYFGVHSGWQWSEFDATFAPPFTAFGFGVSHDSPVIGGQIGIQHQWGNLVLGVEGNLTVALQDNHANTDCPDTRYTCGSRFDNVLTIGPRIGWAMGKWMPYVTGGYANGSFEEQFVRKANNAELYEDHRRHSGWFVGGGVDMALSNGWTLGLDYRHYEFEDAFYVPALRSGVPGLTSPNAADASSDIVTLRVSWKLGRPEAAPLK